MQGFWTKKRVLFGRGFAEELAAFMLLLPRLPQIVVRFLAEFLPWLMLVVGVVGITAALPLTSGLFAVDAELSRYTGGLTGEWDFYYYIPSMITLGLMSYFYLSGVPETIAKRKRGWMKLFWGNFFGVLSLGIGVLFQDQSLTGAVFAGLMGLYVWAQLREQYNK